MTKLFILSLATLFMSLNSYAGERIEKMRAALMLVCRRIICKNLNEEQDLVKDRATMDACLKSKGVEKPERRIRGGKGPRPEKETEE